MLLAASTFFKLISHSPRFLPACEDAARPAGKQADTDPGEMQQPGREHEPDRERKRIGGARQFCAVRMAMRDGDPHGNVNSPKENQALDHARGGVPL